MAGAKQEIMKKCDNSKMDCFVKKGVTGTVDVCSMKIVDKVKRSPEYLPVYTNKNCFRKEYIQCFKSQNGVVMM